METKSGRSSRVSNRSTSSSRLSRPGSAVDLILERIGAAQADTRSSIEAIHADIGSVHADIGAVQADIGAVGAAQVETRGVLETVIHRLERLETSPVPKFVAGLDLNRNRNRKLQTSKAPLKSQAQGTSLFTSAEPQSL